MLLLEIYNDSHGNENVSTQMEMVKTCHYIHVGYSKDDSKSIQVVCLVFGYSN